MKRVVWGSYELNVIYSSFKYDENYSSVVRDIIQHPFLGLLGAEVVCICL